jgi:hypothetical protein
VALVVSKYHDHLPLYRLEDVFSRSGVELARSTLCRWVQATAEILQPLYHSGQKNNCDVMRLYGCKAHGRRGRQNSPVSRRHPSALRCAEERKPK